MRTSATKSYENITILNYCNIAAKNNITAIWVTDFYQQWGGSTISFMGFDKVILFLLDKLWSFVYKFLKEII